MVQASIILGAEIALALVVLTAGALMAWTSENVVKRMLGVAFAQVGALIGLAVLQSPDSLLIAAAAAMFAMLLIAIALLVRLQEAYGGVEGRDFDAADERDEPLEPGA